MRISRSAALLLDRAAVHPRRQQAKPAHTDFDTCRHTAVRSDVALVCRLNGLHLSNSCNSARSSLYSRKVGVSGFWCHRLERPASPRRICAVTRGFQTTTQNLSVFPFLR